MFNFNELLQALDGGGGEVDWICFWKAGDGSLLSIDDNFLV